MRIVCSHDEATLLKIVCHKHGLCAKCALEPFCHTKSGRSDLNSLIFKDPKVALLITQGDSQVIREEPINAVGSSGYTETYTVKFTLDRHGNIIREDGTDMSTISSDLTTDDPFII